MRYRGYITKGASSKILAHSLRYSSAKSSNFSLKDFFMSQSYKNSSETKL